MLAGGMDVNAADPVCCIIIAVHWPSPLSACGGDNYHQDAYTALHTACLHHREAVVATLIEAGADVNLPNHVRWADERGCHSAFKS